MTNAKALVVDDSPVNLIAVSDLLESFGIQVDTAESGQKAIDLVKTNNYDIIFMDHMMPEMDGIEAMRIIRGQVSGVRDQNPIPIIAITANDTPGMKEFYLEKGFDGYLIKPINEAELDQIIKEFLTTNHTKINTNKKSVMQMAIDAQKEDTQRHKLFAIKLRLKNALLDGDTKTAEGIITEMGNPPIANILDEHGRQLYLKLYHYILTGETEKILELCND